MTTADGAMHLGFMEYLIPGVTDMGECEDVGVYASHMCSGVCQVWYLCNV